MKHLTLVTLLLSLAAALPAAEPTPAPDGAAAAPPEWTPEAVSREVLRAMDRTADPCQDFYRYACGGWLDLTELPVDHPSWTRSFSTIRERNQEVVRELLEAAASRGGGSGEQGLIGRYYGACMDEAAIEKAGSKPVDRILRKVRRGRGRGQPAGVHRRAPPQRPRRAVRGRGAAGLQGPGPQRRPSSSRGASACPTATTTSATPRTKRAALEAYRSARRPGCSALLGDSRRPRRRRSRRRGRLRDPPRRGLAEPHRHARPGEALQPARPGGPRSAHARPPVERLPRGPRSTGPGPDQRRDTGVLRRSGENRRRDRARGPPGLPPLARGQQRREHAPGPIRRGRLRLLRPHPVRPAGDRSRGGSAAWTPPRTPSARRWASCSSNACSPATPRRSPWR